MKLEELGRRIRAQREKRGLKQQDLANALRVSPQAVSKWERGENAPDIGLLGPLANLVGVTTDFLLAADIGGRDVFEATVLASSVQGAYRKSLRMAPRDFATWANGLFYVLTESTLGHGGVPIKYMGDSYLCFFSGARHQRRALDAASAAVDMIAEDLRIALGSGAVFLGAMGHPDYARPDITGEAVNATFLTLEWAERHADSGLAATWSVLENAGALDRVLSSEEVAFKGAQTPVTVCEITREER